MAKPLKPGCQAKSAVGPIALVAMQSRTI